MTITARTEKKLKIGDVEWEYVTDGRGARTVLTFHGAAGGAESLSWLSDALAGEFRTVAVTVADVPSLGRVCDAASAILDREHVARASVYGGSFGGMIAQSFAARYPRQVESLVLLSTGAPDRLVGARDEKLSKLLFRLPFPLVRALLKTWAKARLKLDAPPEATERVRLFRERLEDYFDRRLTKQTAISRAALSVEFNLHGPCDPGDFADFPGGVLIVESADDPLFASDARRRLRELFPRAMVCTFNETGHAISLLHRDELIEVLRFFLRGDHARTPVQQAQMPSACPLPRPEGSEAFAGPGGG